MSLVEFLRARLDEAERAADDIHKDGCATLDDLPFPCDCGVPARVLADVQAKRQIINIHRQWTVNEPDFGIRDAKFCCVCPSRPNSTSLQPAPFPCLHLRLLALIDADHQDYQPEWKP